MKKLFLFHILMFFSKTFKINLKTIYPIKIFPTRKPPHFFLIASCWLINPKCEDIIYTVGWRWIFFNIIWLWLKYIFEFDLFQFTTLNGMRELMCMCHFLPICLVLQIKLFLYRKKSIFLLMFFTESVFLLWAKPSLTILRIFVCDFIIFL